MSDYAGRSKYDEPGRAARYRERSGKRNREEWALITRLLDTLPEAPGSALDVPCGTGRVAEALLDRGIPTRAADLSPAMRAETATRLEGKPGFGGVETLDLEQVGTDIEPADLVVCFRFLHHLPTAAHRARVWTSLRRLTRRDLLVSFHHPVSVHNLERKVQRLLGKRKGDRYTLRPAALRREARDAGLDVVRFAALGRYRRELWLAHLRPN